ncbi:cwc22-involved in mrna splicing [Fusarium acuminatum]|uniref:Cwc22-involved in mrna splicing n=1 Tax=Fusarium acuminatum TaxID=5515 RepID=A0ABZ2WUB3_9HYPO
MASAEVDLPRRDRDRSDKRDGDSYRPGRAQRSPSPRQKRETAPVRTEEEKQAAAKAEYEKLLTMRSGGTYIPPARLRALQAQITDKTSKEYQRMAWEALKKSINGLINKVNTANIKFIVPELFGENLVRGRGLFCRSIMKAQAASLPFTPIYAAMAAIVNTKLPQVGELLVRRLVMQFRKGFKRNDKAVCLSSTTFLAHLINQQVQHEMLAGQILLLLLHKPTDDSVEIAVGFCREVGQYLEEMQPSIAMAVFDQFRNILHEADIDKRTQYMIEVLFQVRKDKFKDNPAIKEELDLVEEEDQITHRVELEGEIDVQDGLNIFKFDSEWEEHEDAYKKLKAEILGEGSDDEDDDEDEYESSSEDEEDEKTKAMEIKDQSNADLVNLRRTIYLTIMSSADPEEAVHKLMKINLPAGQEPELPSMIVDRIFIKIMFQFISEETGMPKLRARMTDETLRPNLEGLFPKDNPRNIRFSINYFTSIGMGALTEEMRTYLQNMPKPALPAPAAADDSDSDSVSSYSSYTGSSYSRSRSRSRTPRKVADRGRSLSRSPDRRSRGRSYSSSRSRSYSRSVSAHGRGRSQSYSASPPRRGRGHADESRSRSPAPRNGKGRARSASYSSRSRSRTPPRQVRGRKDSYASGARSPLPPARDARSRSYDSQSRSPPPTRKRDRSQSGSPAPRGRPRGNAGPGSHRRNSSSVSDGPRDKAKQYSRSPSYDSRSPPPKRTKPASLSPPPARNGRPASYSRSPSPPRRGARRSLSPVPPKRRRYSDSVSRSPPPMKRGRRGS